MNGPDKRLVVYLDGVKAALIDQTPQGNLTLVYEAGYASTRKATPLSLSMPLAVRSHQGRPLLNYLWGLLPDSLPTLDRWGAQYGVSASNPASLLRHVGRDAAGAVQVLPHGDDAPDRRSREGAVRELSADDFYEACLEVAHHPFDWDPGRFGGRWSLAGVQPKLALFRDHPTAPWAIPLDSTPTTHIVKPLPVGGPFDTHHINEFLCQRAARAAGLRAANIDLIEDREVRAVVSVRYDRVKRDGAWHRVHQEDLCQALAIHPSLKYQEGGKGPSLGKIALLVRQLPLADRRITANELLLGLAFNTMIGGTDAHAKNYSLLLRGSRVRLAPLYDLASGACYDQHERLRNPLAINGKHHMLDVTDADWYAVGLKLGLAGADAVEAVSRLREALPAAFRQALVEVPLTVSGQADAMVARILDHVAGGWRPNLAGDPRYKLPVSRSDRER